MNTRTWLCLGVLAACDAEGPIASVGINELATAQADGDWVELMNVTEETLSLDGWSLVMGNQRYDFTADPQLGPSGYTTLSGLSLPDAGGMVELVDAQGVVVDEVGFPASEPDEGYGRFPDAAPNWQRLSELTPGGPNR